MLIRVNMEDLRADPQPALYELYRRCKLEEMGFKDTDPEQQNPSGTSPISPAQPSSQPTPGQREACPGRIHRAGETQDPRPSAGRLSLASSTCLSLLCPGTPARGCCRHGGLVKPRCCAFKNGGGEEARDGETVILLPQVFA